MSISHVEYSDSQTSEVLRQFYYEQRNSAKSKRAN